MTTCTPARTSYTARALALLMLAACTHTGRSSPAAENTPPSATQGSGISRLATVFQDYFTVGAAMNEAQILGTDTAGQALVTAQYNTISPENVLKWERVHPEPERYDFALPDAYVAYGEKHRMFIVGHTLVWHSQTPAWVFRDASGALVSREVLLERMRTHIRTVMGRYKGRIQGWDVVNEALEEDGSLRNSLWRRIIGDDFIELAFRYAHEVDPKAELYYNDYSLENPAKRAGAITLIRKLQAAGIKVAAIGMQAHYKMDWPSVGLEDSTITMFAALGVKVNMTELDVDVLPRVVRSTGADIALQGQTNTQNNPYANGLPADKQQALAQRYAEMFAVYRKHAAVIDRVTFWGVTDGDSWLNDWPARGRTAYPLLFDRQHKPKPAFDAIVSAVTTRVP